MAAEVSPLARASNSRPKRIRAMMPLTASKYTSAWSPAEAKMPGSTEATAEYRNAAPVPTAISVFMSAARCWNARQAPTKNAPPPPPGGGGGGAREPRGRGPGGRAVREGVEPREGRRDHPVQRAHHHAEHVPGMMAAFHQRHRAYHGRDRGHGGDGELGSEEPDLSSPAQTLALHRI